MAPWLVVAIEAGLAVAVGVVTAGPAWRRRLGLAIALGCAVLPLAAAPGSPLVTFLAGLIGALAVFRGIDLALERDAPGVGARIWLVFAMFDSRRARARPPGLEAGTAAALLLAAAIATVGFLAATTLADRFAGTTRWALRWGAGVVFAVAAADAATRLLALLYGLVGIAPPPLHDAPHRSRSVAQFWSVRWNKSVGTWLRLRCFHPLARRGRPVAGLVAAFAASTLLHVYLAFVALDLRWALVMGAFFVLQLALLAGERSLGVRRWPEPVARAVTLGVLVLASPLFVEPFLRIVAP